MGTEIKQMLTYDQRQALSLANSPTGVNPYSTLADLAGLSGAEVRVITVEETGGDFTLPSLALASITDNDINTRYIIKVGIGTFVDTLIDLAAKPYVSIIGASINSTIIQAMMSNHHMIKLGVYSEVSFLTIQGTAPGFAGIFVKDGGSFSQLHKVSIYDCDICILTETSNIDSQLYLEYVDFGGVFSYGIKMENTGTGLNFVNAENTYAFPVSGLIACYHITGNNSRFELNVSGNEPETVQGIGLEVHSGAEANIFSTYFKSFSTAMSMPNIGATPSLFVTGSKLENNTTDINIAHLSGQGCFFGTMTSPVITIVTSSPFGVNYLEAILGNKHEIYYDPYAIAPTSGTLPTVAAATTVLQSSVTGLIAIAFSGTADQNASMNFRVPSDYLRNGRFKISFSNGSTSANTFHFAPILSLAQPGQTLIAQTEVLTPQTLPAGTANTRQETTYFIPTTPFVIGALGVLRITRLATNVNDTYTSSIFVNGVFFEYESSK